MSKPVKRTMSNALRLKTSTLMTPIAWVALLAPAAHAAEPTEREAAALSEEATAAGPAVDTSALPSSQAPAPSASESAASEARAPRAGTRGPQAVLRSDRLDLDTTVVTGNRELPKVLYIVPWKKSDLGNLPAQPFNTLLDEALTPVDRDVFRREVTYYDATMGGANATQSTSDASR